MLGHGRLQTEHGRQTRVLTDLKLAGRDWFGSRAHQRAVDQSWIQRGNLISRSHVGCCPVPRIIAHLLLPLPSARYDGAQNRALLTWFGGSRPGRHVVARGSLTRHGRASGGRGIGGTVPHPDGSSFLEGGGTQIEAARLAISNSPAPSMQPASLDEFMRHLLEDLADFS